MASFESTELQDKLNSCDAYINRYIKVNALAVEESGMYLGRGQCPKGGALKDLIDWGLYFSWHDFYKIYLSRSEGIDELTAYNLSHLNNRIIPDGLGVENNPAQALTSLLRVLTEIEFWEPTLLNEPAYLQSEYLSTLQKETNIDHLAWIRDILPLQLVRYAINTTGFKDAVVLVKNIEDEKVKAKEEISFSLGKATSTLEQEVSKRLGELGDFSREITSEAKREKEELELSLGEIKKSKEGIDEIKNSLLKYHSEYNFVGLYDGFKKIKESKEEEIKGVERNYHIFMRLAILIPLVAIVFHSQLSAMFNSDKVITWLSFLAPFAALEGILLYYARVYYSEVNSIKTQLVQINLRGSLCQFIESYMDYRKRLKNESGELNDTALDKFDSLIFSTIQTQGGNIPGALDGVEAIANLAGKVIAKSRGDT
ncbi:hypothetical protein AB6848_20685 [Serratia proteamaculans]|uniref:hypothetical protein n=1 Tax=Serratia proteamaculans TaxID=28151 RepID=UPI0039BE9D79